MNVNKKITAAAIAGAAAISLTACNNTPQHNANQAEASQAAKGEASMVRDQPVPDFSFSQERQNLIEMEEAQASGAASTTFFFRMGVQDPYMVCPSIGAPIASTTQLTNPTQMVQGTNGSSANAMASIGQMDPTGVYTGDSEGTWVLCVGTNGKIVPQYAEPDVHTVFAPAHWDATTHSIVLDGPSSVQVTAPKK